MSTTPEGPGGLWKAPVVHLDVLVCMRPEGLADEPFLRGLFASTLGAQLAMLPPAVRETLALQQFAARRRHEAEHHADDEHLIVEADGDAIGRICVGWWTDEVRVVDIALTPDWRGRGLGGLLLARVVDQAETLGLPVRLHVESTNPARHLYGRLGFVLVDDLGVHWRMERPASTRAL